MLIYLSMLESEHDKSLFERLYAAHYSDMLVVANRVLGDLHIAEDAVHDAFIKIIKNIEKFYPENGHKTGGLCVVIVENISISMLRRSKIITQIPYDEYVDSPSFTLPEDIILTYERHLDLSDIISKLDANNRNAILLRMIYGYSYKEMSELLDITEETARKRVQRGRSKLIEVLSKEGVAYE